MLSTPVLRLARIAIERARLADPACAEALLPVFIGLAVGCHTLIYAVEFPAPIETGRA